MSQPKFNIYINKKSVSINDRGFNYGDGIFETILVRNKKAIFIDDHLTRLCSGCTKLGIKKPTLALIKKNIKLCIGSTNNCILKILLTRGSSQFGYSFSDKLIPNLYFIKIKTEKKKVQNSNIKLGISKVYLDSIPALSKIKHLNRLEQVLAVNELNAHPLYSDLLVLSKEENIIETISSNIFFIRNNNDRLIFETPIIDKYGIDGILRKKIIQYLKKIKIRVVVKDISIRDLNYYNACFKTNSINGVILIDQIQKKKFSRPNLLYNILDDFIYINA